MAYYDEFGNYSPYGIEDPALAPPASAPQNVVATPPTQVSTPSAPTNTALPPPPSGEGINSIWKIESGNQHLDARTGKPKIGSKGEVGVSQILPSTGKDPGFGVNPLQNESEEENRRFGRDYYQAMLGKFGDPVLAAGAYNAGPGRMERSLKKAQETGRDVREFLPASTVQYMDKFGALMASNPQNITANQSIATNPTVDSSQFANTRASMAQGSVLLNSDQQNKEEMQAIATDRSVHPAVRNSALLQSLKLDEFNREMESVHQLVNKVTNANTPDARKQVSNEIQDIFKQNKDPKWGRALLAFLGGNLREVYNSLSGGDSIWAPYIAPNGKEYMVEYNALGQPIGATDSSGPVDYATITGGVPSLNKTTFGSKKDTTTFGKDYLVQTKDGYHNVVEVKDNLRDTIRYQIKSGPRAGQYLEKTEIIAETPRTSETTKTISYLTQGGIEKTTTVRKIGSQLVAEDANGNPIPVSQYVTSMGGRSDTIRERSAAYNPPTTEGANGVPNATSFDPKSNSYSFNYKTTDQAKNAGGALAGIRAEREMTRLENQIGWEELTNAINVIFSNYAQGATLTSQMLSAAAKNLGSPELKDYFRQANILIFSILRPESGAAINKDEILRYMGAYALTGGQAGSDVDTLRESRRAKILDMAGKAGPASPYLYKVFSNEIPLPNTKSDAPAPTKEGDKTQFKREGFRKVG